MDIQRPFTANLESYFQDSLVGKKGPPKFLLEIEADAYSPQATDPLQPTRVQLLTIRREDQAEAAAYYIDRVGPHLLKVFAEEEEFLEKVESSVVEFIADRLAPLFLPRKMDPDIFQSTHFLCQRQLFNRPLADFLRPALKTRFPKNPGVKQLVDVVTDNHLSWNGKANYIEKHPLRTLARVKLQKLGVKGKHLRRVCVLKTTLGIRCLRSFRAFQ